MHKLEIVSDLSKFIIIVYCGNVVITCDLVRFKLSNVSSFNHIFIEEENYYRLHLK